MSAIFGGSKSKQSSQSTSSSTSSNQAYPLIRDSYTPVVSQGNQALSQVSALLGLGGDTAGANRAFDSYRNSTDYDFTVGQGQKAINTNAAVGGLLGSGKTLKSLQAFGQATAQKYLGDYISRLLGIGSSGLQAGSLIAGAGGTSSSTGQSTSNGSSSSNEGMGKFLGTAIGAAAASDRRLKKDIVKLGELDDGLGVYEWTYISGGRRHIGHMADEIEELRPWALGPTIDGYKTVDYAKV